MTSVIVSLDSPSPSPAMASTASAILTTPSRARHFTSVKDMLLLTEDLEVSLAKEPPPPSTKLKRPNKSAILSRKSTNSPSLLSRNGKILGKATKPLSSCTSTSAPKLKTIDSFDIFAVPSSQPEEEEDGKLLETLPNGTKKPYFSAKRLWTPVKENSRPEVIDLCTPDDVAKAAATGAFVSLLDSYKHDGISTITGPPDLLSHDEPLKKGRLIGLVNITGRKSPLLPLVNGQPKEESTSKAATKAVPKTKKPKTKKSIKTITGLAVAPYLPAEVGSTAPQTLPETSVDEVVEELKPKKPRKKRETTATKATKPKKVSKKSTSAHPPLLSPKSVQKNMDTQTFVFGTSSQLLKADPPEEGWMLETTGRKLNTIQTHAKIHSRATWDLENFSDTENEVIRRPTIQSECAVDTSGWGIADLDILKGKSKNGMGMWSMGSRGLLGELHSVEVMDLVDEDDLDDILSQRVPLQQPKAVEPKAKESLSKGLKQPAKETTKENAAPSMPKDLPTVHWTQLPTPASTNPDSGSSKPQSTTKGETIKSTTLSNRPNFEGFTMVQLQTQLQKYGYKPVKSRNTMIQILNRCWDSAEIMAANPPEPVEIKPRAPAKGKGKKKVAGDTEVEIAPKKRGRKPRNVVEVDGEMDGPKPKRRKSSTAAGKLDTSTLFKHIAAAIKHQSTSPDANNQSWWQRILMDETIVVEELAEWLVKSGLQAAGVGGSVWVDCGVYESSIDVTLMQKRVDAVKMWCEARSVSFVERSTR
ncbi:5'-flap endonuclease [Orbilia blumenaviensis]|uniref:Structure-specific endonuclease subunit SLX4 n=1 Tax=Orbilia blumenaviensis TaxID=1796055 RepID=A0AAV9UD43_9PEZI